MADDDEVDDYMTMTFADEAPAKETSLQRRARLQREGRERGRIPSKAELARAAELEREAALSRSLFDAPPRRSAGGGGAVSSAARANPPPASKGLAMMARMGFVAGQSLGKRKEEGDGKADDAGADRPLTEPIRIQVKRDRAGIGSVDKDKEAAADGGEKGPDAKRLKMLDDVDPLAYRDRLRQEREAGRLERLVHAAQVVAERMAEEDGEGDGDGETKKSDAKKLSDTDNSDLEAVNVLWRGLVKERRKAEHERQLRHESQRLLDRSLRGKQQPFGLLKKDRDGYGNFEDDEDDDDRVAMGKAKTSSFLASGLKRKIAAGGSGDEDDGKDSDEDEDGEDKDEELDEFNALPPQERLQKVVDWMRQNRRYCFWCKYQYPDAAMEGCPGPTEEDHD